MHVAHRAVKALVCATAITRSSSASAATWRCAGLTDDLDAFDVVLDESDVLALEEHPRIGIAAQTTQPIDRVRHLVALIRRRFPRSDVRFIDTVCQPTKQRQDAAVDLARRCDVVIVVGGANSNNTRELVKTCSPHCSHVHHVQTRVRIFGRNGSSAPATVGITAGTSTPDEVIDRVDRHIRALAAAAMCFARRRAHR